MKKANQTCIDCHFLNKQYDKGGPGKTMDINPEEREKIRRGDFSWKTNRVFIGCAYLVWSEAFRLEAEMPKLLIETERKDFCFFWKYRPGMLLPAAQTLQEREAKERETSRDRWLTIIGLWIAAIALVIDLIVNIIGKLSS